MYVGSKGTPGRMSFMTLSPTAVDANFTTSVMLTGAWCQNLSLHCQHAVTSYLAVWLLMAQACCWTHSPALHCQKGRETMVTFPTKTQNNKMWNKCAGTVLTSCLSWVWRYMVSVFHYAEEWTSSGDTWEGTQSGPVGSECWESGMNKHVEKAMTGCFNRSTLMQTH